MKTSIFYDLIIATMILSIIGIIFSSNYHVLQTQATVAEVRSDFQSYQVALRSYQLDNNNVYPYHLPISVDLDGYGNLRSSDFLTMTQAITTPVAYLPELPKDPFKKGAVSTFGSNEGLPFETGDDRDEGYLWLEMNQAAEPGFGFFSNVQSYNTALDLFGYYRLSSIGPAQTYTAAPSWQVSYISVDSFYDPSNGTMSFGMITLLQKQSQHGGDVWLIESQNN